MSNTHFKNTPVRTTLKANVKFAYCTCGVSQTFPECDGSHRGTVHKPIKLTPEHDTELLLCRCGRSKSQPVCDGTHIQGKN